MTNNLNGRILFFPRGDTFFRIEAVLMPEPEFTGNRRLKLIEWQSGKPHEAHFLSEIGKELILVDPDFPKEKIEQFLKAAKDRDAANTLMMDIDIEIANTSQGRIETCLACGGSGEYGVGGEIVECGNCKGTGHDPDGPFEVWTLMGDPCLEQSVDQEGRSKDIDSDIPF